MPSKCDTALLIIEVRKKYITNDQKPVLNDDNVVANNDKPIIINIIANDFDPTGKTLGNPTIISNPVGGVAVVNADGTITFTPDSSFVGEAIFQYSICNNATPPACDTATVKINVVKPTIENVRPIAVDDAKSNFKNNSISGTVAANDYDLNSGQVLSYGVISNPINGSVVLNADGTFTYKPDSNYVGPDRFTYQVCDNGTPSKCDTATVYITIFDVPVTKPLTIESTLFEELVDTVCLDTKELLGKKYTVTNVCASANSNASYEVLSGTTCVKVTALLQGEAKACMVVCDEFGVCDTTYLITNVLKRDQVTRVKAKNDEVGTLQGQPVTSNVVKNDSLSIFGLKGVTIVTQGKHGTADIDSSNAIVFVPEADYCGYDYVTYRICNAYGCDTAVVKIKIICNGIKVYSGFSPNGDGVNDFLIIEGLDKFPKHKLEVYNRWGNAVLVTKDYKSDWGGTWTDKKLPDGTYFYIIDDGEGHYYSGYIQIYRGH
jgi:large repetitive protein